MAIRPNEFRFRSGRPSGRGISNYPPRMRNPSGPIRGAENRPFGVSYSRKLRRRHWLSRLTDREWLEWMPAINLFHCIILMIACVIAFSVYWAWPSIAWSFELIRVLPDKCDSSAINSRGLESCSIIIRNFNWSIWMLTSTIIACFGLWLAWRGRQIQQSQLDVQHKSFSQEREKHSSELWKQLQDRFEAARSKLGDKNERTRIDACKSLADLGKDNDDMGSHCVHQLFSFIDKPFLDVTENGESPSNLFPANKALRSDIQEAIDSFSAIYKYYGMGGVDNEKIKLPKYFWINARKGVICLARANLADAKLKKAFLQEAILMHADLEGANLQEANLKEADLVYANLEEANLAKANLEGANLRFANLDGAELQETNLKNADISDADISNTDMSNVKNLTKHQIISAIWGYSTNGYGAPPKLPENLAKDQEVKNWLRSPDYDLDKL